MADEVASRSWKAFRYLRLFLTNRFAVVLIPTEKFNLLVRRSLDAGWEKVRTYSGPDAWVDYGRVDLAKDGRVVRFEWDNWDEGRLEGRRDDISACLGESYQPTSRLTKYED